MEDTGVTWIVTADAATVRIFAEPARSGPLRELADLHMTAHGDELQQHAHHDSGHAGEAKFLRRVANRIALAASEGDFERLVLMASPRALGLLKAALPPPVAARIDATDAHDRIHDNVEAVRRDLQRVRALA